MKRLSIKENKDVVAGSKVPVKYLLDYIKEGYGITDFLSAYPWLKRKDVENAIEEIKKKDFASSYAL